MSDYPILVNEEALTEAFVPTRLLHREGQIRQIEKCLTPALENKPIENIFLLGVSGTGKTTVIKWILENYFEGISAYINCWKNRTNYEVLKEILLSLQLPVHGREPTSELIKKLEKRTLSRRIIVCLDEVDRLKDIDLLYILARGNCGLILVSTSYHSLLCLTSRIRRSLSLSEIEFPAYNASEILDILNERVEYALRPGTIEIGMLKLAALASAGDARVGIEILRKACKKADAKYLDKVGLPEVDSAISEVNRFDLLQPVQKLNDHQKEILRILGKNKSMGSGQLYREYRKAVERPVVDRAYRNYMKKMVSIGIVKSEGSGRWTSYSIAM